MKVLLMQQPKSFSNYPKWIEEGQERFDCLEVMVFTSNDRAAHHSWPSSVIKEIEVSDYSSDSATAKFFDIVRKFKPDSFQLRGRRTEGCRGEKFIWNSRFTA